MSKNTDFFNLLKKGDEESILEAYQLLWSNGKGQVDDSKIVSNKIEDEFIIDTDVDWDRLEKFSLRQTPLRKLWNKGISLRNLTVGVLASLGVFLSPILVLLAFLWVSSVFPTDDLSRKLVALAFLAAIIVISVMIIGTTAYSVFKKIAYPRSVNVSPGATVYNPIFKSDFTIEAPQLGNISLEDSKTIIDTAPIPQLLKIEDSEPRVGFKRINWAAYSTAAAILIAIGSIYMHASYEPPEFLSAESGRLIGLIGDGQENVLMLDPVVLEDSKLGKKEDDNNLIDVFRSIVLRHNVTDTAVVSPPIYEKVRFKLDNGKIIQKWILAKYAESIRTSDQRHVLIKHYKNNPKAIDPELFNAIAISLELENERFEAEKLYAEAKRNDPYNIYILNNTMSPSEFLNWKTMLANGDVIETSINEDEIRYISSGFKADFEKSGKQLIESLVQRKDAFKNIDDVAIKIEFLSTCNALAVAYEKDGNYKKALEYYARALNEFNSEDATLRTNTRMAVVKTAAAW